MNKKEAYIKAIENEISSQNLYKFMSAHCKDVEKNIFTSLLPLEKIHEEKMRSLFSKDFPNDALNVNLSLLPKSNKKAEELRDPKQVYDFAIELEKQAQEAYSALAESCHDLELINFFKEMANEEEKHAELLFMEIERLANTMVWFDESELNGFMEF